MNDQESTPPTDTLQRLETSLASIVTEFPTESKLKQAAKSILDVLTTTPEQMRGMSGLSAIVLEQVEGQSPPEYLVPLMATLHLHLGTNSQDPDKVDYYTNGSFSGLTFRSPNFPGVYLHREVNPQVFTEPKVTELITIARNNPASRPHMSNSDPKNN